MNTKIKTFVLDTNVPVYDPFCLDNFDEHNVVVPIIVIEEIDRLKKGNETRNLHAREFSRIMDALSEDKIFNGGISLGKKRGSLRVSMGVDFPEEMKKAFLDTSPDNVIIATAFSLKAASENVVLLSMDTNVLLKARALGITAETYKNNDVKDLSSLYDTLGEVQLNDKQVAKLYSNGGADILKDANLLKKFSTHQYIRVNADQLIKRTEGGFEIVHQKEAAGIKPRNEDQILALDALLDDNIPLIALSGKAGTGKTLLAIAAALEKTGGIGKTLVSRPIVGLSGKDLGYLPGGVDDKIGPYMQPIFDNIEVIQSSSMLKKEQGEKKQSRRSNTTQPPKTQAKTFQEVKTMPTSEWAKEMNIDVYALAYVRGRTIRKSFFIIDEAQNLTPHEVKTIVTRAGEDTKIIFCGDTFQIDDPYLNEHSNGLSHLIDRMTGKPFFAHIHLSKGERSYLAEEASKYL